MAGILAWDIGGANIKAGRLALRHDPSGGMQVESRPYEIWREKDAIAGQFLREIFQLFAAEMPQALAVTMTAELSDVFATKREGVTFVLETVRLCFPGQAIYVLNLSGQFCR